MRPPRTGDGFAGDDVREAGELATGLQQQLAPFQFSENA